MKFEQKRSKGKYTFIPPPAAHKCKPPPEWQRREDKVRFGTIWQCRECAKRWEFRDFIQGNTPEYSRGAWYPLP
jgi:hypothetical protein